MVEEDSGEDEALRLIKEQHAMKYEERYKPDFSKLAIEYLNETDEASHLQSVWTLYTDRNNEKLEGTSSERREELNEFSINSSSFAKQLESINRIQLFEGCCDLMSEEQLNIVFQHEFAGPRDTKYTRNVKPGRFVPFDDQVKRTVLFLRWLSDGAAKAASNESAFPGRPRNPEYLYDAFDQIALIWQRARPDKATISIKKGSTLKSRKFGGLVLDLLKSKEKPDGEEIRFFTSRLEQWRKEARKKSAKTLPV